MMETNPIEVGKCYRNKEDGEVVRKLRKQSTENWYETRVLVSTTDEIGQVRWPIGFEGDQCLRGDLWESVPDQESADNQVIKANEPAVASNETLIVATLNKLFEMAGAEEHDILERVVVRAGFLWKCSCVGYLNPPSRSTCENCGRAQGATNEDE